MKSYSLDLRERVAAACAQPGRTIGAVATQFSVSVSFVEKLLHRQRAKLLYEKGAASKLPADHLMRITNVLTRLDAVKRPDEMNTPGSDYHPLKGERKDFYSVKVKANWKIIFRFEGEDVVDVDYLDYEVVG